MGKCTLDFDIKNGFDFHSVYPVGLCPKLQWHARSYNKKTLELFPMTSYA
jgi:hypothetical protein